MIVHRDNTGLGSHDVSFISLNWTLITGLD